MKKGCFIKSIMILTVLTAAILYIVYNKFNDFFLNPGKQLIVTSLNSEINRIHASPEKDSLKSMIKEYIDGIKDVKNISHKSVEDFADSLNFVLKDSVISPAELKHLRTILIKVNSNERSEKNRD